MGICGTISLLQIVLSLSSKTLRNDLCGSVRMCDSVWLCLSVCACPSCLWSTTDCTSCYFARACHSHFVMVTDSPSAYICVHVLSKLAFCDWLHLCMHFIPYVVCKSLGKLVQNLTVRSGQPELSVRRRWHSDSFRRVRL